MDITATATSHKYITPWFYLSIDEVFNQNLR